MPPQANGVWKHELYKTRACAKWGTLGKCPYNEKCQFAHGPHELRSTKSIPLATVVPNNDTKSIPLATVVPQKKVFDWAANTRLRHVEVAELDRILRMSGIDDEIII
jgi:hypothetical protein